MTTPLRPGIVGKPLTHKQRAVWDLKQEGKTRNEIAAILGISANVVSNKLVYIRRKLGLTVDGRDTSMLAEAKNPAPPPDMNAYQIENAVDQVNATMKALGFAERLRASLIRRMRVKHEGAETPVKAITDEELKTSHREKLHLIHTYMDDKVMSEATLRDLAMASAALTEKLQLLEGKPTQIISDLERKNLFELMPLLIAEAQRRGITIEGKATEKMVGP